MIRALNTATTGMSAQEANVNTIAHNIANVNTTAFKKGRTEFEDLLYQTIKEPGAKSGPDTKRNVGIQMGSGSTVSSIKKINTQGSPIITNNPFDLMINGEGFFQVVTNNNQVKYTRDGSFNPDNQGILVNKNGDRLFPGIAIPPNTSNINIAGNGQVDVYFKDQIEEQTVGTIPVFTFSNPAGLKNEGKNLVSPTVSSGPPIQNIGGENGSGFIQQGSLEASNVSIMNEMTDLIKAQRAYEMNAKVLGVADQLLQTVNNIR